MTKIFLPVHTKTPGNTRRHWSQESKEARAQRDAACLMVKVQKDKPQFPVRVTLIRCSPRKMDRHNLPGACKHVVDGIADAYGVDDGDERWEYRFEQRQQSTYGVEIVLESI